MKTNGFQDRSRRQFQHFQTWLKLPPQCEHVTVRLLRRARIRPLTPRAFQQHRKGG